MENSTQEVYIVFSQDYSGICTVLEYVFVSRGHAKKYLSRKGAVYAFDDLECSYFVDKNENWYLIVSKPIMMNDEKDGVKPI